MSRAFVKEQDGSELGNDLPEFAVSPHRNLVTPGGLELIEGEIHRLRSALTEARSAQDRPAIARRARDLRYWSNRRASAEVVPPSTDASVVRFGATVVLQPATGAQATFRIVGEDEAAPTEGRISYVSPLARALLGHRIGDTIEFAGGEAEIVSIE